MLFSIVRLLISTCLSDMSNIGRVRNIRENDFLIDIHSHRDVYVPFSAIQNIDNDRVVC